MSAGGMIGGGVTQPNPANTGLGDSSSAQQITQQNLNQFNSGLAGITQPTFGLGLGTGQIDPTTGQPFQSGPIYYGALRDPNPPQLSMPVEYTNPTTGEWSSSYIPGQNPVIDQGTGSPATPMPVMGDQGPLNTQPQYQGQTMNPFSQVPIEQFTDLRGPLLGQPQGSTPVQQPTQTITVPTPQPQPYQPIVTAQPKTVPQLTIGQRPQGFAPKPSVPTPSGLGMALAHGLQQRPGLIGSYAQQLRAQPQINRTIAPPKVPTVAPRPLMAQPKSTGRPLNVPLNSRTK